MKCSRTTIEVAAACVLAITAGCAREQTRASERVQYQPTETAAQASGSERATGTLSDAEVAKILVTVNRGEVAQAEVALGKAESPAVRDYAQRMLQDHSRALERGEELAQRMEEQPRTSHLDQQLTTDTQQTMQELARAEPGTFDRKYLGSQVEAHRKVLDLIDGVLLPSAEDPALRAEIQAVRPVIASHLDQAERIRSGS